MHSGATIRSVKYGLTLTCETFCTPAKPARFAHAGTVAPAIVPIAIDLRDVLREVIGSGGT
jgi:hypothetical protein